MVSYLSHLTVDAHDAYAQSVWWAQVLGYAEDPDDPNEPGHEECMIFSARRRTPGCCSSRCRTPSRSRTGCTWTCGPPTASRDAELARLLGLGATEVDDRRLPDGRGWVVLADPEGNEFCILRSTAEIGAPALVLERARCRVLDRHSGSGIAGEDELAVRPEPEQGAQPEPDDVAGQVVGQR